MTIDNLKSLLKSELHCHLDGSLSLKAIRQLADMAGVNLPEDNDALKRLVTAPETCDSLNEYLKTFDFIRPLLQTEEALTLAAYDVARQAAEENVIYTEIRFAPELSMDQGLTVNQIIVAVCRGLQQAQQDFGIVAKALVCGLRQFDLETTKRMFSHAAEANQVLLVGADFAGNEIDFPTAAVAEGIKHAQSLGFAMTFHAGEQCGCAANIAQAIALGVKRTGHTTAILEIPGLLEDYVKAGVTAEIALTSNLQTKAIQDISSHPYPALKQAGAKISINTDNRTVSDTNLTKEYALYVEHFDLSIKDFYQHNYDAILASFATSEEKESLLLTLKKAYEPYLV